MPRVNKVEHARKAQGTCGKCGCEIKPGDAYVWWKFRFGGRYVRCTKPECAPKGSDLTQSEFTGNLSDYEEQVRGIDDSDHESALDTVRSVADDIRSMGEEQNDKLSNMPDGLQQGDVGQLLQERAEFCDNLADELESAADTAESTCEEARKEAEEEMAEFARNEGESDDDYAARKEEALESLVEEKCQAAIEELRDAGDFSAP